MRCRTLIHPAICISIVFTVFISSTVLIVIVSPVCSQPDICAPVPLWCTQPVRRQTQGFQAQMRSMDLSAGHLRPATCQIHGQRASRRHCVGVMAFQRASKRLKYSAIGKPNSKEPLVITLNPDGSDAWRLEPAIELLKQGGVGIIPSDTLPALVSDLENRDAGLKLYQVKQLDPKKPLSILCRNFQQVSHYTTGFPASNAPGQPNCFNVCKRMLPGPYTLILPASKNLPSQCVDFMKGKTIHRKSVGIRLPDDPVAQAFLDAAGCALLSTSVHVPEVLAPDTEVPDVGSMLEAYAGKGLDFIIDVGPRIATQSTVVDMTGTEPEVIRQGKGDASMFET